MFPRILVILEGNVPSSDTGTCPPNFITVVVPLQIIVMHSSELTIITPVKEGLHTIDVN